MDVIARHQHDSRQVFWIFKEDPVFPVQEVIDYVVLLRFDAICPPVERKYLPASDIPQMLEELLSTLDPASVCSESFKKSLKVFLERQTNEMNRVEHLDENYVDEIVCHEISGITERQLELFVRTCISRYRPKLIEPGTAVVAAAAHSIGEPWTQMTLKTFPFAGVASMNITSGVPRIREIINVAKKISTPIITAELEFVNNLIIARMVKGRVEKTVLGQVAESIEPEMTQKSASGIETVERAVIAQKKNEENNQKEQEAGKQYHLLVEGLGLKAVMGIEGIDGWKTISNHVMEMEQVLGIEGARTCIINEIAQTMASHGISIDIRHLMLLADVMTFTGQVLGNTIQGVHKMGKSELMLASFERPADHLSGAAVNGRKDKIEGVSERIIMGTPMHIGTGMLKIILRVDPPPLLRYGPEISFQFTVTFS
ncbi:hypothetical protein CCACVL1_21234 [Corchorus capsularis]|uniref:DNA-directed RNA polymerase n=1 Tax=Corchorus capsularis TaxID=210143 RepID=A0A1R3H7A4_COCAP|nr:hypothetical protein CCACVL1_21234 [Corchorus capsularis]